MIVKIMQQIVYTIILLFSNDRFKILLKLKKLKIYGMQI